MVRRNRCKHYTGTYERDTCAVGVKYAEVERGRGSPSYSLPCFDATRNPLGATCEKCIFPTEEEVAAQEKEHQERFARIGKAREAIVAHLGGKWKKGTPGASGRIDCPACGATQSLVFSRSGYNGHIHAACATPNCCAWME